MASSVPWNPSTGVAAMTLLARYRADLITTLWTDSARSVQVSADTDPVGAWDDVTANAYHLTQATGADRPIYRTNQQNSLPGVTFNGVNEFLARAFAMFPAGGLHAVFLVMKTPTAPLGDVVFDTATDSLIDRRNLTVAAGGITAARDGGGGSITNNTFSDGDTLLLSAVFAGTDSLVQIDGANTVTGTISADSTASTAPFRLGTRYTAPGGDQFFQGSVYEALFYSIDSPIDVPQVTNDLAYNAAGLMAKWGL